MKSVLVFQKDTAVILPLSTAIRFPGIVRSVPSHYSQ